MKLVSKALIVLSTLVLALPAFAQEVVSYTKGYAVAIDIAGSVNTGGAGPSISKTGGRQLALGQSKSDTVRAMAAGREGSVYAAGKIGTAGFVARVNIRGERTGWVDLAGAARGIGVDAAGNVYVAGDGFLEKLDSSLRSLYKVPLTTPAAALAVRPDGTVLLGQASRLATYSPAGQLLTTFDVGNGNAISGIALSAAGALYLTGSTSSLSLPATRDALRGPSDAFVMKMAADAASAEWSMHLGGSGKDGGTALAVGPNGGLVVVGYTSSADFPGLAAPESLHGEQKGFVAQLDAGGNLTAASYADTTDHDLPQAVTVDAQAKIHVADGEAVWFAMASVLEGPGAGSDSVIVTPTIGDLQGDPISNPDWITIKFAASTNQNLFIFGFQANTGATRTGTITIANASLTVTQAAASMTPAGLVTVVPSGMNQPFGIALDGQGNLYIADTVGSAIEMWTASTQQFSTLANVPYGPYDVSVDAAGDVFIGGDGPVTGYLQEWQASSQQIVPLYSGGSVFPRGISVDAAGANLYVADDSFCVNEPCNSLYDWTSAAGVTQVVGGLYGPWKVAVDVLGNLFIAQTLERVVAEYSSGQLVNLGATQGGAYGVSVDGGDNVYYLDAGDSTSTLEKFSPSAGQVVTVATGVPLSFYTALDTAGNVYFSEPFSDVIQELPRAFVSPGPYAEGSGAGSDSIQVVPASQNLTGVYAPISSDPSWLTITSASNGVVQFSFTANLGNTRSAQITVLGVPITVTQAPSLLPQTIGISAGNNQFGAASQPFATNLQVTVYNLANTPVSGGQVTFTANGGYFGATHGNTYTTTSNQNGLATAGPLIGENIGSLTVTATLLGTSSSQTFNLTVVAYGLSSVAGGNQGALLNQPFPTQPEVIANDQNGNPLRGIAVTFSVPSSGASGTFSGGLTSATVNTGTNGTATAPPLTANGIAGSYLVTAFAGSLPSLSTQYASFNFTNYTPLNIVGGNNQSAALNTAFPGNLTVLAVDQNANPLPGVQVTFSISAGTGAASGTFAGATQAVVATGTNGTAAAPALTANGSVGSFIVIASAPGLPSQTFTLTNVTAGFAYGGNQSGPSTRTLPQPFIVQASAGATAGTIVYTVVPSGGAGGSFNGSATVTVNTNAQGYGTSPQLTANGTPGTFTVTAFDGITTAVTNVTSVECMNPTGQPITVTDTSDNATDTGSLRYAVTNACAGSTLNLTNLAGTITLGIRLRIDDSLTINGPGAATLAIDGGKATRLFFIGAGTVAINNLTLQNGMGLGGSTSYGGGAAGMGGAIYMNGGAVTVSGVTFTGNEALGGTASGSTMSGGGGFGGNAAGDSEQAQGIGGSGGDLFGLSGGANAQNGASGGPGAGGAAGFYGNGGNGGFAGGGGVSSTAPSGQISMSGAGGFGGGGGGGFAPGGSVVYMQPGIGGFGGATGFVGTNSSYPTGGGGAGFGGAIFAYAGTLTLQNNQFLNNLAVGGIGGYTNQNNGQGKGGALFIYNGATVLNTGSIFGTGTTANVAANAGAPGIGSSPAPYTTGATCPVEDTVDVCGALSLPATVSFTGPVSAVYGKTFSVTTTTNSGATAAISVTGGSCQVSGTTVTMTSGTAACQLQATWPANPPYGGATATLSVAATPAATSVSVTGVSTATETYGNGARTTITAALVWNANTAAAPTGGLTFKSTAGGSFVGSANCGAGKGARIVCTQVFAPALDAPGTYAMSASYAGDGNYTASASTPVSDFSVTQQTPTVSVTSVGPASEAYGSGTAVTVTGSLGWTGAGASPTVPAGSRLTFSSTAGGRFGPVSCKGPNPIVCQATFTPTATDPAGSYIISASYPGDVNYTAAQSASTANFFITSDTPIVSVTPNPVTVTFGSTTTVKLTATFTGVGALDAAPAGGVQFTAASGVFGGKSCTTSGDVLTCTVTYKPSGTLAVGTYSNYITASIAAGGDYKATSGSAGLTVTQ